MTPADFIAYRDHLRTGKRRKANTVATKLAILRSFFEYLKAGGVIPLNPASTKLVTPPELPTEPKGRALTPKEVKQAIDEYLKLDDARRRTLHSGGDDAYLTRPWLLTFT